MSASMLIWGFGAALINFAIAEFSSSSGLQNHWNQPRANTEVRRWGGAIIEAFPRPPSDKICTEIIVTDECLSLMREMDADFRSIEDFDETRILDARIKIQLEMSISRTYLAVERIPDAGDGIIRFKVQPSFRFKPPIGNAWTMDHEIWIKDPSGKLRLEKKASAWTALSF